MSRRFIFSFLLLCMACIACFGQASAIRDYVGMISQTFHPDIVSFMEKFKSDLERRGYSEAAKSVDNYLKGGSGTGFLYVADDGNNYIITNYHVISQAHTLSVSFEKVDGERTRFSDLGIVAADEDMDIALLAFAGGQKPFTEGMAFLDRPVQEGDDVYSAGFPGLGSAMIWQLGRGMVSNASVRLPDPDDDTKIFGPFIQHTAQVDPGNSGGPLLIQTPGVPSGYSVAGINTLSARYRQAANYSIPLTRVRTFLDASLKAEPGDELSRLNARLDSFIGGLDVPKVVYSHIAGFLSNTCTGENAEFALSEVFEKAPRTVQNDIAQAFVYSPVGGMAFAVAWTIENALRSKAGKISVTKGAVTAVDKSRYTVSFNVNDKTIDSEWVNEYGIWRIRRFGDFAAGDKSLIKKKDDDKKRAGNLRANPTIQIGAGYAYLIDLESAFGVELLLRDTYSGYSFKGYFGNDFLHFDIAAGIYLPIRAGSVAFTPFGNFGWGFQLVKNAVKEKSFFPGLEDEYKNSLRFPFSVQGGLQFTTAAVPGLYFHAAFQYNFSFFTLLDDESLPCDKYVFVGLGYSF